MLGEDYVVLVKGDDEKAALMEKGFFGAAGERDPVLTLREAKGLEFKIVILWKCVSSVAHANPCWIFLYDYLRDYVIRKGNESASETERESYNEKRLWIA